MTNHRLEITVRADGTVAATTHEVTGAACLDYISLLEDLLEAETVDSYYTDEFSRHTDSTSGTTHDHVPNIDQVTDRG